MANSNFFVDLETTVNGGPEGDSPEAHWASNEVLLCGWRTNGCAIRIDKTVESLCDEIQIHINHGYTINFIAHNAKFDLKYLMRERPDVQWEKIHVWDTMTWEYRQSGHIVKFSSLEDTCARHGIAMKKTLDLGAILDAGVKMEDIDKTLLTNYLYDDVKFLSLLHKEQENLGHWDMDYILPLAEMELNGMCINRKAASTLMTGLVGTVESIETTFKEHIKVACEWQDGTDIIDEDFTDLLGTKSKHIKPAAARTISFLLTGRPMDLKVTNKWRVKYRAGYSPRYTGPLPKCFKNETNLGYPVGEDVLLTLNDWISKAALNHRGDNKLLGTYVSPFLHTSSVQGTIHPKLNTTVTGTGRLSSSAPNGQNIPPPARELVVPRKFGEKMVEIDFSQLEIVGVACVSGCKALLADLKAGVDVHFRSGKKVMGWKSPSDMTKKERTIVKNVNFGLLYGGKAAGLSKQTGVDKKIVQQLIDSFYEAYPGVAKWQEKVFTAVVDNMFASHITDGEQVFASIYDEPFSGRRFTFVEQKSPPWLRRKTGRGFSFSPQQTSNYPIQGFAGGDIVMYALTNLWRKLRGKVLFTMTVHDSIVLEGTDLIEIDRAMQVAASATELKFNLPVALSYDIESGSHWS